MDESADIVGERLAEDLVAHSDFVSGPHRAAELRLHHAHHGLDVRSLVVMLEEFLTLVLEQETPILPDLARTRALRVDLEHDVGIGAGRGDHLVVPDAGVPFVCVDLVDVEVPHRRVEQRWQDLGVARVAPVDLDRGNHVRGDR